MALKWWGVLNLKFTLTEYLLNYGGHVGYAVKPCNADDAPCLDIARGIWMDRLLLVCDDDNYASEKVILRNGGQYEDTRYDPEEAVNVKRYWISL